MTNVFSIDTEPVPSSGAFTGYNVVIQILGEDIAKADRLTFEVNNNIREQPVVSSRTPLYIETLRTIRGNIRTLYVNTAMLRLVLGNDPSLIPPHGTDITKGTLEGWMGEAITTPAFARPDTYFRLPEMTISCMFGSRDNTGDRTQTIDLLGVKFDNLSVTIDANAIILQDVSFVSERIKPIVTS